MKDSDLPNNEELKTRLISECKDLTDMLVKVLTNSNSLFTQEYFLGKGSLSDLTIEELQQKRFNLIKLFMSLDDSTATNSDEDFGGRFFDLN